MAEFKITTPDGTFKVTAPDEAAALSAMGIGQQPEAENSFVGSAKALGSGFVSGMASLAGAPADLISLIDQGASALTGRPGAEDVKQFQQKYGSEAFKKSAEQAIGPLYEPKTFVEKALRTGGEFGLALIGGGASLPAKIASRVVAPAIGAELAGAAAEGTGYEPYAKLVGALGGAVAGPGLARFPSKLITPNPISAERMAAVNVLKSEGVELPASMVTGSKILKAAESELGGAKFDAAVTRMNEQFTAAAINKLSDKAGVRGAKGWTPEVLNAAEDNVGAVFNTVATRNPIIPLDNKAVTSLRSVADDFEALTGAKSPLLERFIKQIQNTGQKPAISGESYQAISSDIARYARAAQQPELKFALQDTRSALDSAVERGLLSLGNRGDLDLWRQARRDWRNMMVLTRAVGGSTDASSKGFITPAKLQQAIDSMKRGDYARGRGEFSELARAGNMTMKPFQDSGTPSRVRAMALPAAAGAVAGGGFGAIPAAALGMASPYLAGRALMSNPMQRYLTNQAIAAPSGGVLGMPTRGNMAVYSTLMNQRPPLAEGNR